jgi:DNA invertase Pin-like site-specific DNA recombinase
MNIAGFIRVSTVRQATEGHSLAAQEGILRGWAEREGHTIVAILPDVMSGAKTAKLHAREAAIRLVEVGMADALAVIRIDRATRSTLDGAALIERSKKGNWPILTTDGKNSLDDSQALLTDIELVIAADERRKISRRTKEGLAAARAKDPSLVFGRPSNVSAEAEALILSQHDAGLSARAIAAALNTATVPTATGIGQWTHAQVGRVIRRAHEHELADLDPTKDNRERTRAA